MTSKIFLLLFLVSAQAALASSGLQSKDVAGISDSTRKPYNISAAFDYQGAFGSGGGVLMGGRAQYLLINIPSFSFGVGAEYHQTMNDYVWENLIYYNSYNATHKTIKGSDELQLAGGVFSFRYKFKGEKIQQYMETGMGYDRQLYSVFEGTSTSRELQSSWYDNSTSTNFPYSYTDNDYMKINYQSLSTLRLCYGLTTRANDMFDFFCDFGLTYYHGTYKLHHELTRVIISGTPPPSGTGYYPYDPYNYLTNSLNIVGFNVSFGVQF